MKHAEVQVFDSLYSHAPTMAKTQVATLLTTENPAIKLNFMDVQMQSGVNDCGLFSIAIATALVMGQQPGAFLFDQKKMRAHLIKCLERQVMSMFPIMRQRRTGSKVKSVEDVPIYCVCRMPELSTSYYHFPVFRFLLKRNTAIDVVMSDFTSFLRLKADIVL